MSIFHKILLLACLFLFTLMSCKNSHKQQNRHTSHSPFDKESAAYSTLQNKTHSPKTYEVNSYAQVELDSASHLKVMDSLINKFQLLQIDGIAHFYIRQAPQPVIIYTGMMKLTTQKANFTIDAYQDSPGQSLKVYSGKLIATKSYPSDFPNTDTLTKGEMILINIDIDLMEKETFDTTHAIKK